MLKKAIAAATAAAVSRFIMPEWSLPRLGTVRLLTDISEGLKNPSRDFCRQLVAPDAISQGAQGLARRTLDQLVRGAGVGKHHQYEAEPQPGRHVIRIDVDQPLAHVREQDLPRHADHVD